MEENRMKTHRIILIVFLLFCSSIITAVSFAQKVQTGVLPKNAKLEVVLYKYANVIGVGYVNKKRFVENQQITFLEKQIYSEHSYRITEENEMFYLYDRTYNELEPLSSFPTIISGIYFVKDEISYIKGKKEIADGFYEGIFQVSNLKKGGAGLTTNPKELAPLLIEDTDITNYKITCSGYEISGEKQNDGLYSLKATKFDNAGAVTIESSIPNLAILSKSSSGIYFLENLTSASVTFENGDTFTGSLGVKSSNKVVPINGEYKYVTGETFIGKYSKIRYEDGRIYAPNGITTLTNGDVVSGDWLGKYDLTNNEWKQIYDSCNSLTEIRDMATQLELKKQQEKIAEERAEQLKRSKEEEQRRNIISKYGEYYGALIVKKKLVPGMSQAMVNEVWSKDFFDYSISTSSGRRIEVWTLNNDKMQIKIVSEANKVDKSGQAAVASMLLMNLLGSTSLSSVPNMLVFVNDKLSDIYK